MVLNELTLTKAREGLREKKFKARDLTEACLEQIERSEPHLKSFITVVADFARKRADWADKILQNQPQEAKKYPLLGIPYSLKDLFCTAGILTTAGSRMLENFVPPYNATVYQRLEAAGAVLLGKTNLDAFAHGSSTEASDFFVTRNPWKIEHLPGGSSGGSAASVVAHQAIFSLGTETGGSIRQPAAWCGAVGLKPTYGRVSRYGVIAMASSLDCPGPITKSVADAAFVLQVIAGHDPRDATSSPLPRPFYPRALKNSLAGIKIGYARQYLEEPVLPAVAAAVEETFTVFEKLGAEIKEIELLDPAYAIAVYTILQRAEVFSNLARYDGLRYGYSLLRRGEKIEAADIYELIAANRGQGFGAEAKKRIMLGAYTLAESLSADLEEPFYWLGQKMRTRIVADFARAFGEVDLIIGPTSPTTALKLGAREKNPLFGEMEDRLVEPSTIAGLPGISLRCGFVDQLPVGLQIIGPQFKEDLVLRAAYAYEQATDWHLYQPPLFSSTRRSRRHYRV